MNIAISTNSIWNFIKFRKELAKSLQKEGHKIFILSKDDKYKKYIQKNIKFIKIPINRNPISIINDFLLIIFFFKIFKKYKINLFLGFSHKINIYGGFVCKIKNIKCILNLTGLGTAFIRDGLTKKIIFLLYKIINFKKSFFLFHNSYDKSLFLKKNILNSKNCFLIPGSGIKITRKKIKKLKKRNFLLFTFIGRLLVHKGLLELLGAAEKVLQMNKKKKIFFNIIGNLDKANVSSVNKNLILKYSKNERINFLGYKENVDNFISKSDCIVLPSYREGLPRILLESLLLERPVITTNVPGCNRIIRNNFNGILCRSRDINSLVEAINKFITFSINKRQRLAINGRKFVEKEFDEKKVINKYLKLIYHEKY